VYVWLDNFWFHSGVTPPSPLCGAWQKVHPKLPGVVTDDPLDTVKLCIPS